MNLVEVGSKRGRTRHYVDADKYKRVSTSKALCDKAGKTLVMYDAVYVNYEALFPTMCKKCKAKSQEVME